jgi:malate synthase
MEDAATAEISRAQLWQWIHHGARMEDGRTVTIEICENLLGEVLGRMEGSVGAKAWATSKFHRAAEILKRLSSGGFQDFLTTAAYSELP